MCIHSVFNMLCVKGVLSTHADTHVQLYWYKLIMSIPNKLGQGTSQKSRAEEQEEIQESRPMGKERPS